MLCQCILGSPVPDMGSRTGVKQEETLSPSGVGSGCPVEASESTLGPKKMGSSCSLHNVPEQ